MPKVEIDTPGVTIRIDDPNAGPELDARALALYLAATSVDHKLPTGPASGGSHERRASLTVGFGTRDPQTQPSQHANIGGHP